MKLADFAAVAGAVVLLSFSASAKSMKVLDIDKGEMAEAGSGTAVTMNDEHAEKTGGLSMLFEFPGHGYIGQYKPKKAAWAGYKKIKFITFNTGEESIETVQFFLRGKTMSDGPENSKTWKMVIPPGKKEWEFPMTEQICDDGKSPLDMSVVFQWQFENDGKKPAKFFLYKIWLED
jgi:hypothetical protein